MEKCLAELYGVPLSLANIQTQLHLSCRLCRQLYCLELNVKYHESDT